MKSCARVAVAAVLVAAAAVVALSLRGIETDLYSLVGDGGVLGELGRRTAARIRVLCDSEETADKCRAAFAFDAPVEPEAVLERVRTHGKGLLSPKSRDLLRADETNRIARSTLRRDYAGNGSVS